MDMKDQCETPMQERHEKNFENLYALVARRVPWFVFLAVVALAVAGIVTSYTMAMAARQDSATAVITISGKIELLGQKIDGFKEHPPTLQTPEWTALKTKTEDMGVRLMQMEAKIEALTVRLNTNGVKP